MSVAAISMVRDEADIVAVTVAHMLTQVDHVIVADNGSTDGTRDLLADLDVEVIDDPERGYYQSRKMTALADLARTAGHDWVVPFDADEVWYSPFGRIADVLGGIGPQWLAAPATLFDHVPTGIDSDDTDPVRRIAWRRVEPGALPKVAARLRDDLVIEQGNHAATFDGGTTSFVGQLVIRHFPYRSAEQFVRKARNGAEAYAATDLPWSAGQHWRQYGQLLEAYGREALEDVFRTWFWSPDPNGDESLIRDPAMSAVLWT